MALGLWGAAAAAKVAASKQSGEAVKPAKPRSKIRTAFAVAGWVALAAAAVVPPMLLYWKDNAAKQGEGVKGQGPVNPRLDFKPKQP